MSDKTAQQIVEAGTEFEGVLRSEAPVVVSGQLKGEVNAPSLTLTNDGSVFGKVKVRHLKSYGCLGGEIEAENVELSGSVSDNTVIRSTSLEIKLEESEDSKPQVSFGNCELHVGNPAKKANSRMADDNLRQHGIQEPVAVN